MIISKGINTSEISVSDVAHSDHFSIIFESTISVDSHRQRDVITSHKDNTAKTFIQVYCSTSLYTQ